MGKGVRNLIGEDRLTSINNKYIDAVCVPYKVELADVKLESLLEELPDLLNQLKKEDYYLMDLDITQDFAGIFNKREMGSYLTSNFNFCYRGEYKENSYVIVENDKTVGIDCLTWLTSNARVKMYNKFICQITSPGVNKTIGNHIIDFLYCPDERLKETFSSTLAREHGITRMEATIYNYGIGDSYGAKSVYNPLEDCLSLLENSKDYFRSAPFYSVSIPKMWTKLTDCLQNSCCLVFNKLLQFVYWGNKNTRKLTGIQITLPDDVDKREKVINYALSAFSFNCLPTNFIKIEEDFNNRDNIRITQKCYIKAGETFFSRSTTLFSTVPENIDIQSMGLVSTSNVIPQVLRKRVNITNRLLPYRVKEIEPLSTVSILSAKKRQLELEEMDLKRRKMDYLEKTATLKEEYKDLLEKEDKITEVRERLGGYFYSRWKNLDVHAEYKVSAFTVNNKGTYTYVGVLAEKDGYKNVYFIKGYYKYRLINIYAAKKDLKEDGFIIIPHNGLDIICLPTEQPFITFTTNGITTYNGNSFAKIEKMEYSFKKWENAEEVGVTQEEMDQFNDITMHEIKGCINVRDCNRLEELPEGEELVIKGLKEIFYRKKTRFIVQLENIETLYISNYWLEKELENLDVNYKIKIKLDKIKHTPNRNKERIIFCV